jgi:hypothetical protein
METSQDKTVYEECYTASQPAAKSSDESAIYTLIADTDISPDCQKAPQPLPRTALVSSSKARALPLRFEVRGSALK